MTSEMQQQQQDPAAAVNSGAQPQPSAAHATARQGISLVVPASSQKKATANKSRKRPAPSNDNHHSDTTTSPSLVLSQTASSSSNNAVLHRVGKDGEPLSEKKLRRLEKNRLSARECRRRKREATENMQGQINQLEGENLRLRLQLQVGEEAEQTNLKNQIDSTKALDELLKSGKASESEIYAQIEEYKEKFADYGRDRRSAMEFHLKNVERLLMPTQTTSFIMKTLRGTTTNGGNEGSSPQKAPQQPTQPQSETSEGASSDQLPKTSKELFTLLVKKLEVTPAQAAALKDSRFVAEEMDETLRETFEVLTELRSRLARCGQDLETEFNCIRQILTPSQSAKFLVWVAQNKACMHMLNELWSKNYPMDATFSNDSLPTTPTGSGSFDE